MSPEKKIIKDAKGNQISGENAQVTVMRLADFIDKNTSQIVEEWESFAMSLTPSDKDKTPLKMRDHIYQILAFIVQDIRSPQTGSEQVEKSQGKKERQSNDTAAETHAALRLSGGFDIDQMVSEYRALRASVIKLWKVSNPEINKEHITDLTRFNESIDQELAESVSYYTKKVGYSKDLFVGILSHELRNPLNVISMSSHLMLNMGPMTDRQTMLAKQIGESASRITSIVNELLDLTRARFGSKIVLVRIPMDMQFVGQQLVEEMREANPERIIVLTCSGDLKGEWDKARIGQVFSNLIGNAAQYGFKDSPININIEGKEKEISLSVQNSGIPIPAEKIETLFDSLVRAVIDEGEHPEATNLGLGLYITKEIIVAHGGTISVTSSEEKGTNFTALFPRAA